MKIYFILFSCLCRSLAITVHYDPTSGLQNNNKEYANARNQVQVVPINPTQIRQRGPQETYKQLKRFVPAEQGVVEKPKINAPPHFPMQGKRREQKIQSGSPNRKQFTRSGRQILPVDSANQNYIQKMANQLYLTQKRASALSEYQKFILNQDPLVKQFVFGQEEQARRPRPFRRPNPTGRDQQNEPPKQTTPKPSTTPSTEAQLVYVTPKPSINENSNVAVHPTNYLFNPNQQNYYVPPPQLVQYTPQIVPQLLQPQIPQNQVTLLQSPPTKSYYDIEPLRNPFVSQPTQLAVRSFRSPKYSQPEKENAEDGHPNVSKVEKFNLFNEYLFFSQI